MKPRTRRIRRRRRQTTTHPFFQKEGQETPLADGPKPFFEATVPVQAKLSIGKPNDPMEHQADAMADKVVQQGQPGTPVQRMEEEEAQAMPIQRMEEEEAQAKAIQRQAEEEEELQPKADLQRQEEEEAAQAKPIQRMEEEEAQAKATAPPAVAPRQVEQKVKAKKGQGSQLPAPTLQEMNQSFGVDFSSVSIHTDSESEQMNQQIRAQAFTHGKDIYFNKGKFSPNTRDGKHLLAHELTHTIQQKGDSIKKLDDPDISTPVPKGAKKNKKKGSYSLTINGVKVKILPDKFKKGLKGGSTSIKIKPKKWTYGKYNMDEDGKITSIKSPTKMPKFIIRTTYGLKSARSKDSAYGRGTTKADKKAKNTSLRFHEGNHGLDYLKYLTDNPFPKFPNAVGMKEADFLAAVEKYTKERDAYMPAMEAFSDGRTDCVGVTIDEYSKSKAKPGESYPVVCGTK